LKPPPRVDVIFKCNILRDGRQAAIRFGCKGTFDLGDKWSFAAVSGLVA